MITKERKKIQAKLRKKYGYQTRSYSGGMSIIKPRAASYMFRKKDMCVVDMAVSVDRYAVRHNMKKDNKKVPEIEISLTKYEPTKITGFEDKLEYVEREKWEEKSKLIGQISFEELELIYKAAKEAVGEFMEEGVIKND